MHLRNFDPTRSDPSRGSRRVESGPTPGGLDRVGSNKSDPCPTLRHW